MFQKMNKAAIVVVMILFSLGSCTDHETKIGLVKNIYLSHSSDDVNSGYSVHKKIDENFSEIIIGEDVLDVHYNSFKILVKSVINKMSPNFYRITLNADTLKNPTVLKISEHQFLEDIAKCNTCKEIKPK
jgi:hypothetical protein